MSGGGVAERDPLAAPAAAPAEATSLRPRLGAMFAPDRPLDELRDAARQAERVGLDEFWVVEDCFLHGGLTAAAAALAVTSHVRVGVGLLPVAVRNAAIVAMELATLATLHPCRFRAAFGHGVESWMEQIDARPRDRLVALREVVGTVRALLHGATVSIDGDWVSLDDVALDRVPAFPPQVFVGTTGPKGIAVAGDVADGLLLPEGTGPAAVEWARGSLPGSARTIVYAWLRVEEDGDRARAAVRPLVHAWRDGGLYPGLVAHSGIAPAGELDPAEIDAVAIAGTPLECAKSVMRLAAAGATSIVLRPVGDDAAAQLDAFGEQVLPLVLAEALSRR
jgi:5,10-methylenetetrahydromethanopterin reductase